MGVLLQLLLLLVLLPLSSTFFELFLELFDDVLEITDGPILKIVASFLCPREVFLELLRIIVLFDDLLKKIVLLFLLVGLHLSKIQQILQILLRHDTPLNKAHESSIKNTPRKWLEKVEIIFNLMLVSSRYTITLPASVEKCFLRRLLLLVCSSMCVCIEWLKISYISMGSQLCPGTAKEIIHELEEIQKGQKSYGAFFKDCLTIKETKLHELLVHQSEEYHQSSYRDLHLSSSRHRLQSRKDVNQQPNLKVSQDAVDMPQNSIDQISTVQVVFDDGTKFKGSVIDGLPDGQGEETTPDGDHYKGNFKKGVKQGKGKYVFANSERYEGDFRQNMMWGKGVYYFGNGDKYEGEFMRNQRSGEGKYIFSSQNKQKLSSFEGHYRNDLKEGTGTLKYVDFSLPGLWKCGLYELRLDSESIQ